MNGTETFLFETAFKSAGLMALVCALMFFHRQGAAAPRHFLWLVFLGGLLLLPLGSILGPGWRAPAWAGGKITQWTRAGHPNDNEPSMKIAGRLKHIEPSSKEPKTGPAPKLQRVNVSTELIDWRRWLLFGWAAGVAIAFGRFFLCWATLRGIERESRISENGPAQHLLRIAQHELGLKRGVRLLESSQPLMPMTWGWWRPVVLLPSSASSWEPKRLWFVLRHELAHVQRWDCLAQALGNLVNALYWFNPFVWHALRQMRLEQERACDDVVLGLNARASDYAGHLLAVAEQFGCAPNVAALPMARHTNLEARVSALLDFRRKRGRLNPLSAWALAVIAGIAAIAVGGCHAMAAPAASTFQNKLVRLTPEIQRQAQINTLKSFAVAKERQSMELAAEAGEKISPEYQRFFDAAANGDSKTILTMFDSFKHRHRQYSTGTNVPDPNLDTAYWQPVLELCLAYQMVAQCEPKYTSLFANGIIRSIPLGSVYFGGTDPGRGLPAAFSKNHAAGVPFFTLTQNALADGAYLRYLREMYGKSLNIPSDEDSQLCFNDYLYGAQRRLKERKLRPDEDVKMQPNGQVQVSGVGAVMGINGLLVETIFDKNPGREFFIEESYPLDWMYPYLKPHGLIMQIQRQPLTALPEQITSDDRKYWQPLADQMIGPWLRDDTLLVHVTEFSRKIYVEKDLAGFTGDPLFVHNEYAAKAFSKLRSTIAGLYAWRVGALINVPTPPEYLATDPAERERISAEADYAFRQAFALCPYSAEVALRYTYFLAKQDRKADALMLAEMGQRIQKATGEMDPKLDELIDRLKEKILIDPVFE